MTEVERLEEALEEMTELRDRADVERDDWKEAAAVSRAQMEAAHKETAELQRRLRGIARVVLGFESDGGWNT